MTIYINKVVDEERPWLFVDDTKESILADLSRYALDPIFEDYGNFVHIPAWKDPGDAEKYKGFTMIWGNFFSYSHAFNVLTDEPELIAELEAAIRANQATVEYRSAKETLIACRTDVAAILDGDGGGVDRVRLGA